MTEIRQDEYLDHADGLAHCHKCGGPRQVVITNPFHHRIRYVAPVPVRPKPSAVGKKPTSAASA